MNWYYALHGQQQGPVDETQLKALIAAGTLGPDSLAWRDGMTTWQPLREVLPEAFPTTPSPEPAFAPANENEVRCHECGCTLHRVSATNYGTIWICPACKPVFLQKAQSGQPLGPGAGAGPATPGTYVDPGTLVASAIARQPLVSPLRCLSRAWAVLRENLLVLVGATLLNLLCQVAASGIPFLGIIIGSLIQGPLLGGLYWMHLRALRGQPPAFGDAFSGFSQFAQLMMAGVVMSLIGMALLVPGAVFLQLGKQGGNDTFSAVGGGLLLLALPFVVYLSVSWIMTYLLIVDRKYEFWTAMHVSRSVTHKCWGSLFALLLLLGLLQVAGLLALCFGLCLTLPLAFAALTCAYEDVFHGESRA